MRPLSAVDAISPAWAHTSNLLWRPRSWRVLLKIGAVAVLAQMAGFNFSGSNQFGRSAGHGHHQVVPPAVIAAIVAGVALIAIAALLVWLVLFYIGSRMQFVLFEVVLRRDTQVAPIWARYGAASWRWIALKLLFAVIALAAMLPLLLPMALRIVRTVSQNGLHDARQWISFMAGMLGFGVAIFLLSLLIGAVYRMLVSFGLPSMALESTPLGETVRRVIAMAQAEPVPVFLYLLMNLLLSVAGGIACWFAIGIVALAAAIPLGCCGALLWAVLHAGGPVGHALMIAGWAGLGLVMLAVLILAAVMLFGYLFTFLQAYALYFLGGRYPAVGAYLDPLLPPAHPVYAPAPGYAVPPAS